MENELDNAASEQDVDQADTTVASDQGDQGGSEPEELDLGSDEAEDGGEEEAAPRISSANRRIQQEISRRKELEQEREFYRQRAYEAEQRNFERQQAPAQRVDPDAEYRYLESLHENDRVAYLVNKQTAGYKSEISRIEMMMHIQNDRKAFEEIVKENPQFKRYEPYVEQMFAESIQRGQPRSREEILAIVAYNDSRNRLAKSAMKARETGEENLRRQQTRPGNIRSGVSASSGGRKESAGDILRRRLANGEYNR